MFKRIARAIVVSRTASALSKLSDHQLADIGIARPDIYKHVEKMYD